MKSAVLVLIAWIGTLWLRRLPYRLDPSTSQVLHVVLWAVIVLFILGLVVGISEALWSKNRLYFSLSLLSASLAAGGLIFFLVSYDGAHSSSSPANQCIYNLHKLDVAVEELACKERLKPGTALPHSKIMQHLNENKLLQCPEGGTYTYGVVEEMPRCSVAAHNVQ